MGCGYGFTCNGLGFAVAYCTMFVKGYVWLFVNSVVFVFLLFILVCLWCSLSAVNCVRLVCIAVSVFDCLVLLVDLWFGVYLVGGFGVCACCIIALVVCLVVSGLLLICRLVVGIDRFAHMVCLFCFAVPGCLFGWILVCFLWVFGLPVCWFRFMQFGGFVFACSVGGFIVCCGLGTLLIVLS